MKNINKFTSELAEYINNHIVGTENTKIKKCGVVNDVRNRGHVIPIQLVLPEDLDLGGMQGIGPAFYAEELLQEFPNNTVEAIAEILNVRVNEFYPSCINMFRMQSQGLKNIDEYSPDDIIITAMPTLQCRKEEVSPFVMKEDENLALTLMLKAKIHENTDSKQAYYAPIPKTEGHEVTKTHWETAKRNSFAKCAFQVNLIAGTPFMKLPVFGSVKDTSGFYDFFYLLNLEEVWSGAKDDFDATRVYIIPNGAYDALFVLDSPMIQSDPGAANMIDQILKKAVGDLKNKPLPVFVLDCHTMQITKYEG